MAQKVIYRQLSNSTVFWTLLYFNDPKNGKYAIGWLAKTIILEKAGAITTALEKYFTSRKSFEELKFEIYKLVECCTLNIVNRHISTIYILILYYQQNVIADTLFSEILNKMVYLLSKQFYFAKNMLIILVTHISFWKRLAV